MKINFHTIVDLWQEKSCQSPVHDMVLRKYVFLRLKAGTFLSRSHTVTGKVGNSYRLKKPHGQSVSRPENWKNNCPMQTISEISTLKFILIKKYKFIMKNLTDFRTERYVETGMDSRLVMGNSILIH